MAKDPGQRYPSAAAMRAELQELGRLAQATPHPPLVPDRVAAPGPPPPPPPRSMPSQPSRPSQPFQPSPLSAPTMLPFGPPPPAPAPRRRRTALIAVAAVATVALVAGIVAALALPDSDDEPGASSTASPEPSESETPTGTPTESPTELPTASAPTRASPPPPPPTSTGPTPTYPDVPAASGIRLELGSAAMRAPDGWGRVTQTDIPDGVGSRDYSDFEGYYSSVFLERSKPAFPLTSLSLLELVAAGAVDVLADKNPELDLVSSETLPPGWLDGQQAARVRGVYKNTDTDLFFAEESWFVQRGRFLYRLTFQHSRADSLEERRADIDPTIVSFRWR